MSRLSTMKITGLGPFPRWCWWNMNIQNTDEVISKSAVKPEAAGFATNAFTKPTRPIPSLEKCCMKKM